MITFKKDYIYQLNEPMVEGLVEYALSVNEGDYIVSDCLLLDANMQPVKGYEHPVPIERKNLKEMIAHIFAI